MESAFETNNLLLLSKLSDRQIRSPRLNTIIFGDILVLKNSNGGNINSTDITKIRDSSFGIATG
jgi:hypothetical protein